MSYFERDPHFSELSPLERQLGELALNLASQTPGVEVTIVAMGADKNSVRAAGDMYAQHAVEFNEWLDAQRQSGVISDEAHRDVSGDRHTAEETLKAGGVLVQLTADNPSDALTYLYNFNMHQRQEGQSRMTVVRDPNA
jgi:hypothetical protein